MIVSCGHDARLVWRMGVDCESLCWAFPQASAALCGAGRSSLVRLRGAIATGRAQTGGFAGRFCVQIAHGGALVAGSGAGFEGGRAEVHTRRPRLQ